MRPELSSRAANTPAAPLKGHFTCSEVDFCSSDTSERWLFGEIKFVSDRTQEPKQVECEKDLSVIDVPPGKQQQQLEAPIRQHVLRSTASSDRKMMVLLQNESLFLQAEVKGPTFLQNLTSEHVSEDKFIKQNRLS